MARRRHAIVLAAVAACLAGRSTAAAGHADDRDKRYRAVRTASPPRIDGRLDDPEWQSATADDRFTQNFPDEGRAPSQRTELRVLYDDAAIYVAIRCWDEDAARIVPRLTRRDRETDADRVTVDISSKADRNSAFHFDINAAGVQVDGVRFNDTDYSGDWDGLWMAAVSRDAHGWSAELLIPLKTLRYAGGRSQFGFEVRRYLQRRQEVDEWAYVPRAVDGEVAYYGILDGLVGLRARRLFAIAPYLAAGLYQRYQQAPAAFDGTRLYGNIGADLKLGLTPALTLDATVNPDFNQIEADPVVLNLTTFEVFYPEKRPFFLEGFELFATPLQIFYSRRIGRPPPLPDVDTFQQLTPAPEGRIYAAAKLTGQLLPRLYLGALDALTGESSLSVSRVGGSATPLSVSTAPLTNFALLRFRREFLANSYVGVIGSATTRFEQPFSEAPQAGDACPDGYAPSAGGRCTTDEYVGGVDFGLRTRDGGWGMVGQAAGSLLANGPDRLVPDGTLLRSGTRGLGLWFEGGKYDGRWGATLEYRGFSPGFDDNELGYNPQSNLQSVSPHLHYRILKPVGAILDGDLSVNAIARFDWGRSTLLQQQTWVKAQFRFASFWRLDLEVDYDTGHWDLREARDGAAVERAGGFAVGWNLKSDNRRRVWFESYGGAQQVLHGLSLEATLMIALRPTTAVEIDLTPHAIWTFGDPRWYDTTDGTNGSHTYYFAELDSRVFDATLRISYAFAPTLTLQAYAQLFVDGGHYGASIAAIGTGRGSSLPLAAFAPATMPAGVAPDFADGAINVNAVLRWELQLGSTLQLVYTHAQVQTAYDPSSDGFGRPSLTRFKRGPGTDLFLVKLTLVLM